MKLGRKFIFIIIAMGILLYSPSIFASTVFTADIEGLGAVEVLGFTVWLDVSDDFSFSDFSRGDAIPAGQPGQVLGYGDSPPARIEAGPVFQYGAFDQDNAFIGTSKFPLMNGTLFSFSYDGSINDLALAQFDPGNGSNLFPDFINSAGLTADGVTFQVVPIPSAILLLGGGLIGLIAVRRRRS
jgi:hypothetical protein